VWPASSRYSVAMPKTELQLLDCTLRDGGYYNAWDFDHDLITDYLVAMEAAGIQLVELGFRTPDSSSFVGAVGICAESFINDLEIPNSLCIGVMLNAKDLIQEDLPPSGVIDSLFVNRESSRVSLVRIACGMGEVPLISGAVSRLKNLGYDVGVNLMQVHNLDFARIREFGRWCSDNSVDLCYFADSFGALEPARVGGIIEALKSTFGGPIGCHFHDNKSLATANVLAAIDSEIDLVDVTVTGMGRGPGNAKTEYVGPLLREKGLIEFELDPVLSLIDKHFGPLLESYRWGTNPYYLQSALANVHPSYVQRLLSDGRLDSGSVSESIRRLGAEGGASYSLDRAASVELHSIGDEMGDWSPADSVRSGRAIILGPGDGLLKQARYINSFLLSADRPTVFNLNLVALVDPSLIDFYVALSVARSRIDFPGFEGSGNVITPHRRLGDLEADSKVRLLNYGAKVEKTVFRADALGCAIPHALTAAYALAVAVAGGSEVIYLAGWDGFQSADPRQNEMEEVLQAFRLAFPQVDLLSLTPTSYQVPSTSVFMVER